MSCWLNFPLFLATLFHREVPDNATQLDDLGAASHMIRTVGRNT
jgi:hypothetical protein